MECLGLNHHAALYVTGGLFDPPQAIGILEHAQRLAEQTGDRRGLAETSLNVSRAAQKMHYIKGGFDYGELALALARDLEEPPLLASCLLNLAYLYVAHRQWETAEAYATEAQQRYETIGNLILEDIWLNKVSASMEAERFGRILQRRFHYFYIQNPQHGLEWT